MKQLVCLFTLFYSGMVSAHSLRQDAGYYQASEIWIGDELKKYSDLDPNSTLDGSITTIYAVTSFGYNLKKGREFRIHLKWASSTMNNFSAGASSAGESMAGFAEFGLTYSALWKAYKTQTLRWNIGFKTPFDKNLSPYRFNSINDGQTRIKVGLDYNYTYRFGGINIGVGYIYRPGIIRLINVDDPELRVSDGHTITESSWNVPDLLAFDLSLPFYLGKRYLGLIFNHEQAISGIDIDSPSFNEGATISRPPFPATRETRSFAGVVFGMILNENSAIDVTINGSVNGRNSDKGSGINIGYSQEF